MLLVAPKASGIVLDQQVQALEQAAVAGECFHDGLAVADHTGLDALGQPRAAGSGSPQSRRLCGERRSKGAVAVFAIGGNGAKRTLRRRGTAQLFHIFGAELAAHILGGVFERVDIWRPPFGITIMPRHDGLRISPLRGDALRFHGRAVGDSTWPYFYAKHMNVSN